MAWYCIRTNIRGEYKAREGLQALGMEVYLPERQIKRKLRHKRVSEVLVHVPLLPRYMFVANEGGWFDIRATDGVESVLGVSGRPLTVPAHEIERFRELQELGFFDAVDANGQRRKLTVGERYEFTLAGGVGIFSVVIHQDNGGDEVVVTGDILGRSTKMRVPVDKLRRAA